MSGAQRNLNVHGACASVMSPTMRMSTPMSRIQSGMAIHTSPSGMPDENDISVTDAVRQEVNALARLTQVPGFFGFGGGVVTLVFLGGDETCGTIAGFQHPPDPGRGRRPVCCE